MSDLSNVKRALAYLGAVAGTCGALACGTAGEVGDGDDDVDSASQPTLTALSTDWEAALGWCNHASARLHTGDFNGDGRSDMLCHDNRTGYKWIAHATPDGAYSGTTWEAGLGWCMHSGARLHTGDFNGDGRSDMLCHDNRTGYKWIALATPAGVFTGTTWEASLGWCSHANAALFVGDFNGDGRDDLLCHDTRTGYKWIAHATPAGTFSGTTWEAGLGWCMHTGAALRIGDFDGDGRSDLLCHDTRSGYKWVALATPAGTFTGTTWEASLGWCNHASASLFLGDFNGDSRADMLCHDVSNGYKWVALATENGAFSGTSWEGAMGWCHHTGAMLLVDDVNGDWRDDLLCHDVNSGYKWVSYGNL